MHHGMAHDMGCSPSALLHNRIASIRPFVVSTRIVSSLSRSAAYRTRGSAGACAMQCLMRCGTVDTR